MSYYYEVMDAKDLLEADHMFLIREEEHHAPHLTLCAAWDVREAETVVNGLNERDALKAENEKLRNSLDGLDMVLDSIQCEMEEGESRDRVLYTMRQIRAALAGEVKP